MTEDNSSNAVHNIVKRRVARQYRKLDFIKSDVDLIGFDLSKLPNQLLGLFSEPCGSDRVIPVKMHVGLPHYQDLATQVQQTLDAQYIGMVSIEDAIDFILGDLETLLNDKTIPRNKRQEAYLTTLGKVSDALALDEPKEKTIAIIVDELLRATNNSRRDELEKVLIKPGTAKTDLNKAILIYSGKRYTPGKTVRLKELGGLAGLHQPRGIDQEALKELLKANPKITKQEAVAYHIDEIGVTTLKGLSEYAAVGITSHMHDELIAAVREKIQQYKDRFKKEPRKPISIPKPSRKFVTVAASLAVAAGILFYGIPAAYDFMKSRLPSLAAGSKVADLDTIVNEYYTAAAQLSKAQGGRTPNEKAAVAARLNELKEKYNLQVECHEFFGPYKGVVYQDQLQEITGNMCDKKSTRVLFEGSFEEVVTKLAEFYIENEQRNGRTPVSKEKARGLFAESLGVIKRELNPVKYGFTEGIVTYYSPLENVTYHDLCIQQQDGNMRKVVGINR